MAVVYRTRDEILPALIAGMVVRGGLSDIANSSNWLHVAALFAREIEEAYYQLRRLLEAVAVQTATGEDLDERAADYGLTRLGSLRAIGQVVVSRTTALVSTEVCPSSQVFLTSADAGNIAVRATIQGQITQTAPERISGHGVGRDSDPITCVAVEPGVAGNIPAGQVVRFQGKPAGIVSVTNLSAFTGGRDRETDDELRGRILLYIASLPRSTVRAIEAAVLGAEAPSGKRVRSAHLYEDPVTPGKGILYIDDGAGTAERTLETAPSGLGLSVTAPVSNVQTLSGATAPFPTDLVGRTITVAGGVASAGANNGAFPVNAVAADGSTVSYTNAVGVVEAPFPGTWILSPEIVVASALGGEQFFRLAHYPVKGSATLTLRLTRSAVTTTLVRDTDFYLDDASGWIYYPSSLVAVDLIDARYSYFTDLIAVVQKIVDGDDADALNYPGYRPATSQIRALAPTTVPIPVRCRLVFLETPADYAVAVDAAETAITAYVNALGISGDVIWTEIIKRVKVATGAYDLVLEQPPANVVILDSQIARVSTLEVT